VQDNNLATWNAYRNQYWPADYFVDANGQVRHTQFGEGEYKQDEAAIRQLLFESGARQLPPPMTASAIAPSSGVGTPETYLNPQRAMGFNVPLRPGVHAYPGASNLALNEFALKGTWNLTSQSATPVATGGSIEAGVQAARVYLVMTSDGNVPRTGTVLVDGKPVPARLAGADVGPGGRFTVRGQRLYSLLSFPTDEQALITVQLPPGVRAYSFTFG
jgi:hypothetical protein